MSLGIVIFVGLKIAKLLSSKNSELETNEILFSGKRRKEVFAIITKE